jgi:hypothetical protein
VYAALSAAYAGIVVFLTFTGPDEGDAVNEPGSAELDDNGTLGFEISFDNGDDAILKAARK